MSLRRMMLATLGAYVQGLIDAFKARVLAFPGIFEAEACLKTQLDAVNDIGLLQDATIVITPNGYNENILHTVKGNTITAPPYNLAQYTESTIGWTAFNTTLTSNTSITNPFGVNLANRLVETAAANFHYVSNTLPSIVILGRTYTYSVYLKKGIGATAPDIIQLQLQASFSINYANFNISTGNVTATSACTATISSEPNGWWRCSITATATVSAASLPRVIFCNNNPTATVTPSYTGATTSDVYFIGTQVEEAGAVSAYQPVIFTPTLQQGYLQHTRSTTGYRTESTGLVREVPQENLLRHSSDFIQSTWAKQNGCTISNKAVLAPDGVNYADGVNFTTDVLSRVEQQNIPIGIGLDYTFSVWLRADSDVTLNMIMSATTLAINVTTSWQRFSITITAASTTTTPQIRNNGATAKAFYMWGAQLTQTSTVQSYYPTLLRANTPRIDYTDGSCPTLLLEQAATNLLVRSEEFDNASWIKSNVSVTPNTDTAPNGLLVADTLTATSNDGFIRQNGQTNTTSVARISSIYLKRKTGTGNIILELGNSSLNTVINSSNWTRCDILNSMSGTYSSVSGLYTITITGGHGLLTGDSIRFFSTSGGAAGAVLNVIVISPTEFQFTNASATLTGTCIIYPSYLRVKFQTSGDEIYAWGGQIELSSTTLQNGYYEPTSYIPTTTATVTRATDALNLYKIRDNNLLNDTFSLFWEVKKIGGGTSADPHLIIGDTTSGLGVDSLSMSGLPLTAAKRENNSGLFVLPSTVYQPLSTNYYKGLITCNNGIIDIWIDGSKLSTSTMTNYNKLSVISLYGNGNGISRYKQVLGWNKVLTRDEIDLLFQYPYFNAGYTPTNNELQQIINRAYAEGFTLPNATLLGHCDTLITEMKNDGVWNVSDVYFNFAYNDVTLTDWARINWMNPYGGLGIATLVGGMTYQVDGFKGNSTNAFVNTQYYPFIYTNNNYTLDNAGRMFVVSEDGTINNTSYDGLYANRNTFIRSTTLSSTIARINAAGNGMSNFITTNGVGIKSIMRDSSTNIRVQVGNTITNSTQTSVLDTTPSRQLILHNGASSYSDACISNYWMGASINNTQINNFRTYYNTYLTNIGLTAFA